MGIHDAPIHRRCARFFFTPHELCARLGASLEYGWYFMNECPFSQRRLPDLLNSARAWKSESPDPEPKLLWESRELGKSLHRIHILGKEVRA
jgi:hypothetical protein